MRRFIQIARPILLGASPSVRTAVADSGHGAHRYRNGIRSFRIQRALEAGTIRKRRTGNLTAFGKRHDPYNAVTWTRNDAAIISSLKYHRNGILP